MITVFKSVFENKTEGFKTSANACEQKDGGMGNSYANATCTYFCMSQINSKMPGIFSTQEMRQCVATRGLLQSAVAFSSVLT